MKTEGNVKAGQKIPVKAVYFDAGHTLLKTHPSIARYAAEVAQKYNPQLKEEDLSRVSNLVEEKFRIFLSEQAFHWSSRENVVNLWVEVYGYWMELVGFDQNESRRLALELYERLGEADCWVLYPDVQPTLEFLKANHCYLGIISNWDERLEELIKEMGLEHYFSFILASAQAGFGKPDGRLFEKAAEISRIEKEFTLVVGDDPQADFYGATNAGFAGCLIDRENKYPNFNGLKITSLIEIKNLLSFL